MSFRVLACSLLLSATASTAALAFSAGQASTELGASTGCGKCHSGGSGVSTGNLSGPGSLFAAEPAIFTVMVQTNLTSTDGGTGPAGFTLAANKPGEFAVVTTTEDGGFSAAGAKVRIVTLPDGGTEATQSAPKRDVDDQDPSGFATFAVRWTPHPDVQGAVVFSGYGVSSNNDGSDDGDSPSTFTLGHALCVRFPKGNACGARNCGEVNDGCGAQFSCGTCTPPQTCGGGGTPNVCGCAAKTCADLNAQCGQVSDGCGQTLECGTCGGGKSSCGGGGTPHVCGCSNKSAETCNGIDDDCNGTVDDGDLCGSGNVCRAGGCGPADGAEPGCSCAAGPGLAGWLLAATLLAVGARSRRRRSAQR